MRSLAGKLLITLGLTIGNPALASQALPLPGHARYVFQKVGEDAGLSTITAVALFQDHLGFIWIGTDHGLLRYDGTRIVKYSPDRGFPSTEVEAIAETADHHIIAAAREYFGVLQGSRFQEIHLPDGIRRFAAAQPFATLPNGHIYVATERGLFSLTLRGHDDQVTTVATTIIPDVEIQAVYASRDGRVWIVEASRMGWFREGSAIHWISKDKTLRDEPTLAILQEADGTVWVRNAKHLGRLDPAANRVRLDPIEIPSANDVGAPSLDRDGRLMIPTIQGLFLHRDNHWDRLDSRRGAASDAVMSVIEDKEGTFWIGYGGHGIERWQGDRTWSGWTTADGLPDNVVWSEIRDRQDRLWVGTNNGVAMWDAGTQRFRVWTQNSGLNGSTARELAVASDGAIWVLCHPGGLTRFDSTTLQPRKIPFSSKDPTTMASGPDGRLWIAGPQYLKAVTAISGVPHFDDIPAPPGIVQNANSFSFAPDGGVWLGGRKGLAYSTGGEWHLLTKHDGLASDDIVQVIARSSSEVWIRYGDSHGVGRITLHNGRVQSEVFDTARGLQSDEVYMMGMDRAGNVWAGGPNGVASIASDGQIRRYGHSDGLIWEDQSEGGFHAERDGSLLFGTSGGLARFDPNAESARPLLAPNVVFTSIAMGGREREDGFHASHRENTLQANFAVLSYRDPAGIRCRYRMHGLESDYTETAVRELRYPALPPGDYRLDLSCRLPSGVTSDASAFSFVVVPAWWQTSWARGLAVAGVVLMLYGVLRLRTFSLERDRARLERAVLERSRELERANQELQEAALTDPLTGTRNRRYFQMTIEADMNQLVRAYLGRDTEPVRNRDLIFYLIDVDHFKQVNDVHGHDAGDELLIEITRRISCAIRQSDILIRWGGEEFLVVSRYTQQCEAGALAARILHSIGLEPFALTQASAPLRKTCSIGWAALPWSASAPALLSHDQILALADQALYEAKHTGRNRAVGFVPGTSAVPEFTSADAATAERLGAARVEICGPEERLTRDTSSHAHSAGTSA